MGLLIGITGAIGSGKSTFAKALADCAPDHSIYETYQLIAEVGDSFNQALKAELEFATARNDIELVNQALIWLPDPVEDRLHAEVSWAQLAIKRHETLVRPTLYGKLFTYLKAVRANPKILDKPITVKNLDTYRHLLQWLGGYFVTKINKNIWYNELMRRVDNHNGTTSLVIVCGVRYPGDAALLRKRGGKIITVHRPGIKARVSDLADITQATRHIIRPDHTVLNNGKAKDLAKLAEDVWRDLGAGNPKARYQASA
jgi:energy-coupling factor transporter ATP-binding protein EcfA2